MLTAHSLQSMVGWIHCFGLKVRENSTVQAAVTEAAFPTVQETQRRKEGRGQGKSFHFPVGYIISTSPWSLPIPPGPPPPSQMLDLFSIIVTYMWMCVHEYCLLNLLFVAYMCLGVGPTTWHWIPDRGGTSLSPSLSIHWLFIALCLGVGPAKLTP